MTAPWIESGRRWVEVDPARLPGWVSRFGVRHVGRPVVEPMGGVLVLLAPDGTVAECHPAPGNWPIDGWPRCGRRYGRPGSAYH